MFYFAHLNFPVFLQLTFITHIMREKSFLKNIKIDILDSDHYTELS